MSLSRNVPLAPSSSPPTLFTTEHPTSSSSVPTSPSSLPSAPPQTAPSRPGLRPLGLLSSFPSPPTHIPASPSPAGSPLFPASPLGFSTASLASPSSTSSSPLALAAASSPRLERLDPTPPRLARIDTNSSIHRAHVVQSAGPPPTTPLPPIPDAPSQSSFVAGPPPTAPLPPLPDTPSPVTQEARGEAQRAFVMRRLSAGGASVHSVGSVTSSASKSPFSVRARRTRMRSGSTSTAGSISTLASVSTTSSTGSLRVKTMDIRVETGYEIERGDDNPAPLDTRGDAARPLDEFEGQEIDLPSRTTTPSESVATPRVGMYGSQVHSDPAQGTPTQAPQSHSPSNSMSSQKSFDTTSRTSPSNSISSQKFSSSTNSRISPSNSISSQKSSASLRTSPGSTSSLGTHESSPHDDPDPDRDGASSPDIVSLIERTQSNTPRARSRSQSRRRRTKSLHSSTHDASAALTLSKSTSTVPQAGLESDRPSLKRLRSTPALNLLPSSSSVYPHARPAGEGWDEVWRARAASRGRRGRREVGAVGESPLDDEQGTVAMPDQEVVFVSTSADGGERDGASSDGENHSVNENGNRNPNETDIENELEIGMEMDDESEDDVIDLRTPLPHLMLRAGLLSPHSKLLPRMTPSPEPVPSLPGASGERERDGTLQDQEGDGMEAHPATSKYSPSLSPTTSLTSLTTSSTLSLKSSLCTPGTLSAKNSVGALTKSSNGGAPSLSKSTSSVTLASSVKSQSSHLRDERDTERRRARHKDGRLLRGGIGLTTGLGWSDSEDEDAPSDFTNRLSRSLSRKSSYASGRSAASVTSGYPPSSYDAYPGAFGGYATHGEFEPGLGGYGGAGYGAGSGPPSVYSHSLPASTSVSATVSRASSVASSPVLGGPEGRSLSRSVGASPRGPSGVRRTPSGASMGSTGVGGDTAGGQDMRESSALPYLAPPMEMEEKAYEDGLSGASLNVSPGENISSPTTSVPSPSTDIPIPEYPYVFRSATPTDQGHSSIGHGDVDELVSVRMAPRSPLFDNQDPFARLQRRAPAGQGQLGLQQRNQQNLNHQQAGSRDDDRSPTPTFPSSSAGEEGRLHLTVGSATVGRSSKPVISGRTREDESGLSTMMPPPSVPVPRVMRLASSAPRPVSKALPPLPTEYARSVTGSTPPNAIPRPQSRTSSGIPKTASTSSLRSMATRQGNSSTSPPTSVAVPGSVSSSVLQRERAASNASIHSVRSARSVTSVASARSVSSVASGSTATGGSSAAARVPRPSLPVSRTSSPSLSAGASSYNFPSSNTSPPSSSSSVSSSSPPGAAFVSSPLTPRAARKRTSSTSSNASGRPLKSAIKPASGARGYAGGMVVPRASGYATGTAPVAVGVGQTGIAI